MASAHGESVPESRKNDLDPAESSSVGACWQTCAAGAVRFTSGRNDYHQRDTDLADYSNGPALIRCGRLSLTERKHAGVLGHEFVKRVAAPSARGHRGIPHYMWEI